MLGTHLICNIAGRPTSGVHPPSLGMEAQTFHKVSRRLVWQDRYSQLSCTSYEHYPVFACENDDFLVHLEGPRGYDKLQLWTLFTLTSTIGAYTCPPALGDDFLDRDFV